MILIINKKILIIKQHTKYIILKNIYNRNDIKQQDDSFVRMKSSQEKRCINVLMNSRRILVQGTVKNVSLLHSIPVAPFRVEWGQYIDYYNTYTRVLYFTMLLFCSEKDQS